MQTIEDGMIKECLMSSEEGNVQGVAENSSMLVARRQQRMIIDASMELVTVYASGIHHSTFEIIQDM
jgi:hypothetical protein